MHMEDQGGGDGAPVAIPPQEGEEEVNSFLIAKLLRLKFISGGQLKVDGRVGQGSLLT